MKVGIYPGSFDPVTCGHLDIIERAAKQVDFLIVAVLYNYQKGNGLFTVDERKEMLSAVTSHLDNVEIDSFSGLLVDYAKAKNTNLIIRGLRSGVDLEAEMQLAQMNKKLMLDIETIFLLTAPEHRFVSSSSVRELSLFQRLPEGIVPTYVEEQLKNKWNKR
ncbi:pantetheine-phosphate adenylyltransferase [Cellulosilyticum ruminicola]|uniref:pantetheine-phosphate adenylyltransferase n=1 Tax=Cellulosilyticum ruminicola TaxID=425254 RepID=UPI0006D0DA23|nr:pantetheine-phosphate adenylyltransferase [Cellulosilyticum ruminicola]